MSFAAEPDGVFVDDLLTGLTGGVARESFVYLPEENPFKLVAPGPVRPGTVRVHGLKDNAFRQFQRTVDFAVDGAGTLTWLGGRAVRPDEGTRFYVNYEHRGPSGAARVLSDRNPGSVTRLLAESFAREYAVLSGQLEAIYQGAFLETATGRDLDNIALLVGVVRRDPSFATGSVIFSRAQPAKGDIAVPAGTKLSTSDAPAAHFETTEDRTLRRGSLTVEAPVQAEQSGAAGVVPAGTITVINRPILGITAAENPQATRAAGGGAGARGEPAPPRRAGARRAPACGALRHPAQRVEASAMEIRIIPDGNGGVGPMLVNRDQGRGVGYAGTIPEGETLTLTEAGRAMIGGTDVTAFAFGFDGAVFADADAEHPEKDASFDDAVYVTTAPAGALDRAFSFPHSGLSIPMPEVAVGKTRMVFFVQEAHFGLAADPPDRLQDSIVTPRTQAGRFSGPGARLGSVFAPGPDEARAPAALVGFAWQEREAYKVRVLIPPRFRELTDDPEGVIVTRRVTDALDRFRPAGVTVETRFIDDRWILGDSAIDDEAGGEDALIALRGGMVLWPAPADSDPPGPSE